MLIFIVGSPRSGTSYVGRALGLADDACYLEDSKLFSRIGTRSDTRLFSRKMYPTGVFPYHETVEFLLRAVDQLFQKNRIEDSLKQLLITARSGGINGPSSKPSLDAVELNDLQKLTEDLNDQLRVFGFKGVATTYLEEFAKRCGKTNVIERTAEHLRYLPLIHAVFPEARVVLTRREKRQCIESCFRTNGAGSGYRKYIPQRIREKILWRQLIQDEGRERWAIEQPWVTAVKFNDVMTNPVQELSKLADELELNISEEKLKTFVSGNSEDHGH